MPSPKAKSRPARERVPPHNEEAERGVLGCALLDFQRVIDLCVLHKITPDAFYVPQHRLIYETLLVMNQSGRPADLLSVNGRMRTDGLIDRLDHPGYLDELVDSTPTAAHAEYYIQEVRERFILRTMIERAREIIDECYETTEDADDVLSQAEERFFEISDNLQNASSRSWNDILDAEMNEINRLQDEGRGMTGLMSGYNNIDKLLMGFQPADMIILAARPSMGKTALALNIAERVATERYGDRKKHGVAIFSLEMSSEALVRRLLCSRARVESQMLRGGYLPKKSHAQLMDAANSLKDAPLYIDDAAGLSALEVRSRARRIKSRHDIELIIVDYLQMMHYPGAGRESRQQEVAAISNCMKAMAKELRVPVLMLSQLSRAPESRSDGKPKLSDLRDSGSIEQDADVVLMLRRPSRYENDERKDDLELAIVEVAKHRNGPTGEIHLNFEESYTRFEDREDHRVTETADGPSHDGGY